jgi:hypothetical protein
MKKQKEMGIMVKRQWHKALTVMVLGAFLILGLSSLTLAQVSQEIKDANKMMSDAWKQFDDGQRIVIEGLEKNNLAATQAGVKDLMTPGNKTVGRGRDTVLEGARLFKKGKQTVQEATTQKVAKKGMDMMKKGFHIMMDGKQMMEQGQAMNDQVAQSKGITDKFNEGNQLVKTGMGTMGDAIKNYMQGESMYLRTKSQ